MNFRILHLTYKNQHSCGLRPNFQILNPPHSESVDSLRSLLTHSLASLFHSFVFRSSIHPSHHSQGLGAKSKFENNKCSRSPLNHNPPSEPTRKRFQKNFAEKSYSLLPLLFESFSFMPSSFALISS